ncbi:HigA family addiction module antitoxin [Hyphomicrobium sp.]|jgi:antitoxin HigA-1|uniref:HigA family addiction module antitoxin n=1 Tax=Hyphomicrobium sp. TaxID=82 RepID=UPI001D4141D0|nr:HigA family addiction module antitoxin [Hyphomicrobium sp.]MBY0562508.1 HigA family addiction module antidote protein [Hyphomicrobium sp.]
MPRIAVHPGKMLAEELAALGVSPSELARQIEVPPNRISQIINGKRAITGDTALRLAHWFKTTPELWLDLQTAFDLHIAEDAAGRAIGSLPTRVGKARSIEHAFHPRKIHRTG